MQAPSFTSGMRTKIYERSVTISQPGYTTSSEISRHHVLRRVCTQHSMYDSHQRLIMRLLQCYNNHSTISASDKSLVLQCQESRANERCATQRRKDLQNLYTLVPRRIPYHAYSPESSFFQYAVFAYFFQLSQVVLNSLELGNVIWSAVSRN